MIGQKFIDPKDNKPKIYFGLRDFDKIIVSGIQSMEKSDFIPTCIVGIPTGGWSVLKRLSAVYPSAMVGQIDAKGYDDDTCLRDDNNSYIGDKVIWRPSHNGLVLPLKQCEERIPYLEVLVVDDLSDTGWTFEKTRPIIEASLTKISLAYNLTYFTVWKKASSPFLADYYGLFVEKDPITGLVPWIVTHEEASCDRIKYLLGKLNYPLADCLWKD